MKTTLTDAAAGTPTPPHPKIVRAFITRRRRGEAERGGEGEKEGGEQEENEVKEEEMNNKIMSIIYHNYILQLIGERNYHSDTGDVCENSFNAPLHISQVKLTYAFLFFKNKKLPGSVEARLASTH